MLKEIITKFPTIKILVIGDLMLDEYIWGDVSRISPEAPVPVIDVESRTQVPGGACNVAMNIASLGGKVVLGGIIGDDFPAKRLCSLLDSAGIDRSCILRDPDRPTITKTRVVARGQQMLRVDTEKRIPHSKDVQDQLLADTIKLIPEVDVCIFSDYAKGISTPEWMQSFIVEANRLGKPVLIDPKGNNFHKYKGVAWITPNKKETEIATGLDIADETILDQAGQLLLTEMAGTNILIKLGAKGMRLYSPGSPVVMINAISRQVYDVTGAGDTVIGTLGLALATGASPQECAALANIAAGIAVSKVGTSVVTARELIEELESCS